ncbi:radical SAM protein [Planosporangium flavigriseum]|uniref:Radical SAM core domain-containing protein n=1 Tax=Planosporangium flavigriseum TaxID=373681 RepID=A0A8J3PLY3_9ACTN|nr:radical SAM protein [Planosporangium flavigriseum]NJC67395.1 radical SAM protein [Planosporangium flavigriseum]GIG74971.1 hypothetical protein Pfl04_33750 [Planosporangium flavigriseum]
MAHQRLDLTSKIYQHSVWPAAKTIARGERSSAPLVVDLDPTTFCDLACPECISGKLLNNGRFTKARLGELAAELAECGVQAVVLIGGGEPLAHPGTGDVIRVLGENSIAIGVVTNGTMIDRHLDALAKYASWVRVSVDAATPETFRLFRPNKQGGSEFDKVIRNMQALAAAKTGSLGYSFLTMSRPALGEHAPETNHREIYEAARLAKQIGCDYFELKTMFDDDHYIVTLDDQTLAEIRTQLGAARSLENDGFEVVCSSTYLSLDGGTSPVQVKPYSRCRVAELRTLVTPTGVYVCSYHRGNPAAMLGDAVTQKFHEIWETSDRGIVDPRRDCSFHCARHQTNLAILAGAERDDVVLTEDFDPFI